jgi:hypothetical protein
MERYYKNTASVESSKLTRLKYQLIFRSAFFTVIDVACTQLSDRLDPKTMPGLKLENMLLRLVK